MKKNLVLSLIISFFVAFFAASFAFAQTPELTAEEDDAIDNALQERSPADMLAQEEQTAEQILQELDNEAEELEGVEVEEPASAPSGFGLWFHNWRERISVALTLDPVKKAEKQLVYAEERMAIAQKILEESTNPNAQQKAEKMIEVAQKHINRIQEKKDKWIEKTGERVEKLKENLATHQLRRDHVMEKIEEKLPEDAKEKFERLRERMLEKGNEFIGDIDDGELSPKTFEHLRNVRERIEIHKGAVKEYRIEKKELLKDAELSKEERVEKIRLLWDERKSKLEEIRFEFKEKNEELKEKAQAGDEKAKERLEKIEEAREILKEKNELIKERANKLHELKQEGVVGEELKGKMEELREAHKEIIENFQERKKEVMKGQAVFSEAVRKANIIKQKARLHAERVENELNAE